MSDLFANLASAIVTSGGTTAPSAGTVQTFTVSSQINIPAASSGATPPSQFRLVDAAMNIPTGSLTEIMLCTNVSGSTWTVTRGAEGTTPQAHTANWVAVPIVTAAGLASQAGMLGMQVMTGGGQLSSTVISTAIGNNYTGIWLDPRCVWTVPSAGLVIHGIQNFTIASAMTASIGWSGNIVTPTGFINTSGSATDGVQIFATTGSETQGIIFRGLVFIGANSNAVLHNGGRARSVRFYDCFAQNLTVGSGYGFITDTQLGTSGQNNSEDLYCENLQLVAWTPLGLGVANGTQNDNDSLWVNLTTYSMDGASATGTTSLNAVAGTNHTFINAYDRSQPTSATYTNSGAKIVFFGGEDDNQTGGAAHLVSGSGQTIIQNRLITGGTSATTVGVSGGTFLMRGRSSFAATCAMAISGGTVDLNDSSLAGLNNLTISGSGGNLMLAPVYSNAGAGGATVTYTGNLISALPAVVAFGNNTARTTTQTLTWTPPAANVNFRVTMFLQVTVAGTSTVPSLTFTRYGGAAYSQNLTMVKEDGASTALLPAGTTTSGAFTATFSGKTDNSAGVVTVTITPTTSTFTYSIVIEQLTAS